MIDEVLKQVSVLYVEDDDVIRPRVERGLSRRVGELYTALNGEEGLELYKEKSPDIVLTDIKMPKMNGIEMSKEIKKIKGDTPIIIMSAHSEADYLLESIEMGIDGYLLKPVDKDKLFSKLIYAAKEILYERQQEEHKQLVQELIDLQPSIIFSADNDNKLLFVNKTFLEFFCCRSEIKGLDGKNLTIDEFFDEFCNKEILETKIEDISWLNYLLIHHGKTIEISFKKDEKEFSFWVVSKYIEYENGKKHIIMTLSEIKG